MSAPSQLKKLREPFTVDQVQTRPGGGGKILDFVPIETTLERLLDVAPEYSWEVFKVEVDGTRAFVAGHMTIGEKTAAGVGAMVNPDLDMALKSANSEAMKNAAKNGWGVTLELWNEGHRDKLGRQRALASGSERALKEAVVATASERLGLDKPSAAQVAEVYGVSIGELADPEVLRTILEGEGVL